MKYKLFKQEQAHWCFPACLQSILLNYNIFLPQYQIAEKVIFNRGIGADINKVKKFLKELNFKFEFYYHNETPWNEPESLLSENNNKIIAIPFNYVIKHVFLVEDFKDPIVFLLDPENPLETKQKNLSKILKQMHEFHSGGFGIISKL